MAFNNMVTLIKRFMVIGIILLIVGLAFVIYGAIRYESRENVRIPDNELYGIAIDAGGGGTRLYVYEFQEHNKFRLLARIKCEDEGIASYESDQFNILEDALLKCTNKAKSSLPSNDVPVYMAATAGMRLLKLRDQKAFDETTKFIEKVLNRTNLKIGFSKTISGHDEAKFAWVAANFLRNDKETEDTVGIAEMGSTSTQLAFATSDGDENADISEVSLHGKKVKLYSHSYMCFGRDQIENRYLASLVDEALNTSASAGFNLTIDNPCDFKNYTKLLNGGYLDDSPCVKGEYAKNTLGKEYNWPSELNVTFKGTGNTDKCRELLSKLLQPESDKCKNSKSCGINNIYQPEVNGEFLGLGVFTYGTSNLGVSPDVNMEDYLAATRNMCDKTWSEIQELNTAGTPLNLLNRRCLDTSLSFLLLTDGFKFNDETWKLKFSQKVNGKSISWTLGMIEQEKDNLYVFNRYSDTLVITKRTTMLILIAIGSILLIIGLILLIILCYLKRRYEKKGEETLQLHMAS